MGLFGAMTASVSGLSAQGEAISVISDNLSNTNTIGYKTTRALFSQLVTTGGSGGSTYNAGGAQGTILRTQNEQGSIISSTSGTDLSISGNGFFSVTDTSAITTDSSYFYTRAGAFSEDKEGFMVNPAGYYLQGWQTDSDGNIVNLQEPTSIELQSVGVSAQATGEVRVGLNLTSTEPNSAVYDTTAAITAAANLGGVVSDPTTADYVTDVRVYDAQGGARDVSLAMVKRGSNMWDWVMYTDGINIEGGTSGTNSSIANGTMRFNQDGTLKHVTGNDSISVDWAGGISDGAFDVFFGDYTGGSVVSSTTGLDFTDHVRDISIEDDTSLTATTAPAGTYTLSMTAANSFTLTDPNGDTATVTTSGTADQELLFQFSGGTRTYDVRMSVSSNFAVTSGAYPVNTSFVAGNQGPYDQGSGSDGTVQFSASYNTAFINQNGFGSGTLSSIQVDDEGFISGTFTNGENKKLWKIAIAVFQNPSGLNTASGSLLTVTESSGQALLKQAGNGGTGSIISGALEGSTVDIANEFSNMIVSQRAYQANSTVISTVDQMLNELLQLR